jgi:pyruvate kinase
MKQKSEDLRTRLGKAALSITADMAIKALVIPSHTGRTAKYVASFRGRTRIFAPCFNSMKMRQLNLSYGINTTLIPEYKTTDKLVVGAISSIIKLKKLSSTDLILVVHATPKKFSNATNFLEINTVKNILKLKK